MEELTFNQIADKYGWNHSNQKMEQLIVFAKNRGVIIELAKKGHPSTFRIIKDIITGEEWADYPNNLRYEVSKNGLVRVKDTKKIVGSLNTDGYITITDQTTKPTQYYKAHRMVMETFNPIQNSESYVVDHINGIKNDNRLENLRWLTQRQNMNARDENYAKLNINFQKLVEKYGYEKLNHIFEELLKS